MSDIIEEADAIAGYVAGKAFADYRTERLLVDGVERCLSRITEAVIRIGADRMRAIDPDLPVEKVRGLGNLLRHAYDFIDPELIWDTVQNDLPALRAACERALNRT